MNIKSLPSLKKIAGYSLLFLLSLFICFLITFPYGALKGVAEAKIGDVLDAEVTIGRLTPSIGAGIVLHEMLLKGKATGKEVRIKKADVSVALSSLLNLSPIYQSDLEMYGGTAEVSIAKNNAGKSVINATFQGLDLSRPDKSLLPVNITGKLQGKVKLRISEGIKNDDDVIEAIVKNLDAGNISFQVIDGSIPFPGAESIKAAGVESVPASFTFKKVESKLSLEKNVVAVSSFEASGGDFQTLMNGRIDLVLPLTRSQANLNLRFKPLQDITPQLQRILASRGFKQDQNKFYTYWSRGSLSEILSLFSPDGQQGKP